MSRKHPEFNLIVVVALLVVISSRAADAAPTSLSPSATSIATGLSIIYDPASGRVTATAPEGSSMTAFELRSQSGAFDGSCDDLSGPFDVCTPEKVFKLDTEGFGQIDFGQILPAGMSGATLLADLTADGASKGGGFATGQGVFLVHADFVPEPLASSLFAGAWLSLSLAMRQRAGRR